MNNIMIDIETLGNTSNSTIISIGAVFFDVETGNTGSTFHKHINIESCLDNDLTPDGSTIKWWMKQGKKARGRAFDIDPKKELHIRLALIIFSKWIKDNSDGDAVVWGNSARFDCGLLTDAFNKLDIPVPWRFRNERCVRTLASLIPEIKQNTEFKGIAHDALDDCYHQIKYSCETLRRIKLNTAT